VNLSENFKIVLPLKTDEKVFEKLISDGKEVCAEMPRGIFTHTEQIKKKAEKLFRKGVKRFFCPTLDSAVIIKEIGGEITASFGSNIFNSYSLDMWKKYFADEAILSPEMTVSRINNIRGETNAFFTAEPAENP
jgi:collagenase-like PrtC family protease